MRLFFFYQFYVCILCSLCKFNTKTLEKHQQKKRGEKLIFLNNPRIILPIWFVMTECINLFMELCFEE